MKCTIYWNFLMDLMQTFQNEYIDKYNKMHSILTLL